MPADALVTNLLSPAVLASALVPAARLVREGRVVVAGWVYDLGTGRVDPVEM